MIEEFDEICECLMDPAFCVCFDDEYEGEE